jgi:hypothetical protein
MFDLAFFIFTVHFFCHFSALNKASKHMEEHIIAAHSALVVGYMLLANEHISSPLIDIKKIIANDKLFFKNMAQVIAKFLQFMKMMASFIFYFVFSCTCCF